MKTPENTPRPPRWARSLLNLLLRTKGKAEYAAEVEELFRARVLRDGAGRARSWYWRQVLGFVLRWRSIAPASAPGVPERGEGALHGILPFLDGATQDLRQGLRRLRHEPTFSFTVAMTMALGIGASAAIFGVASTTGTSRLPYLEPDRVVVGRTAYEGAPEGPYNGVSALNYFDYRESSRSFQSLAAVLDGAILMTVTGGEEPWAARTGRATWNLFSLLGVNPVLGRSFLPEEEVQADAGVVLISHSIWQNRFGGDRDVLGRTLLLEGSPHSIVGVLPSGFRFLRDVDVWRVVARPAENRYMNMYYVVGRLGPGTSLPQAQLDVDATSRELAEEYPVENSLASLHLSTLQHFLVGDARSGLLLPAAATACLLLLACANVAGLFLARGHRRTPEMAIRSALGGSKGHLARHLLTESVALTLPASLLGVGVAYLLQGILLHLVPLEHLGVSEPVMNIPVFLFALMTAAGMGLVVGIVPAIRGVTVDPARHLGSGRQPMGRGSGARFRGGLVAVQIWISLVLLVGSGLVARSFFHLADVDLGFTPDEVLTLGVRIPATVNQAREGGDPFFPTVLRQIGSLPNVRSVGAINRWPIQSPGGTWRTRAQGRPLSEADPGEGAYLRSVSPGYFGTMRMAIVRGRDVLEEDRRETPLVAVVSESLAGNLYPGLNPVGRSVFLVQDASQGLETEFEIVGVVADVRLNNPRQTGEPVLYLSALQASPTWLGISVRARGDGEGVTESIRQIVSRTEAEALVTDVTSMTERVNRSFASLGRVARYLGLFAGISLLLAAVGLYGALAYYVSQQEHEIGVRMASGATRAGVLSLVLKRGARLVGMGLILGLATAYPGSMLIRELLFETPPLDPLTYLGAVAALLAVATSACLIPALRASRVDPAVVLKGG